MSARNQLAVTEKRLYSVNAVERDAWSSDGWDVEVLASNISEARRVGVAALVKLGLIRKQAIKRTSVIEYVRDVFVAQ